MRDGDQIAKEFVQGVLEALDENCVFPHSQWKCVMEIAEIMAGSDSSKQSALAKQLEGYLAADPDDEGDEW